MLDVTKGKQRGSVVALLRYHIVCVRHIRCFAQINNALCVNCSVLLRPKLKIFANLPMMLQYMMEDGFLDVTKVNLRRFVVALSRYLSFVSDIFGALRRSTMPYVKIVKKGS